MDLVSHRTLIQVGGKLLRRNLLYNTKIILDVYLPSICIGGVGLGVGLV